MYRQFGFLFVCLGRLWGRLKCFNREVGTRSYRRYVFESMHCEGGGGTEGLKSQMLGQTTQPDKGQPGTL